VHVECSRWSQGMSPRHRLHCRLVVDDDVDDHAMVRPGDARDRDRKQRDVRPSLDLGGGRGRLSSERTGPSFGCHDLVNTDLPFMASPGACRHRSTEA